jgi:ribonuclease HII
MNFNRLLNVTIIAISLSFFGCNKQKVEKEIKVKNVKTDEKFGLTELQRKELFKEIVKAEDKANEYKRAKEDSLLNLKLDKAKLKKEYEIVENQSKELLDKYKLELVNKYKINIEQEKEIGLEGLDNNWPLD